MTRRNLKEVGFNIIYYFFNCHSSDFRFSVKLSKDLERGRTPFAIPITGYFRKTSLDAQQPKCIHGQMEEAR
jgi:hypothetical protein